jgi:hypothetical protein
MIMAPIILSMDMLTKRTLLSTSEGSGLGSIWRAAATTLFGGSHTDTINSSTAVKIQRMSFSGQQAFAFQNIFKSRLKADKPWQDLKRTPDALYGLEHLLADSKRSPAIPGGKSSNSPACEVIY